MYCCWWNVRLLVTCFLGLSLSVIYFLLFSKNVAVHRVSYLKPKFTHILINRIFSWKQRKLGIVFFFNLHRFPVTLRLAPSQGFLSRPFCKAFVTKSLTTARTQRVLSLIVRNIVSAVSLICDFVHACKHWHTACTWPCMYVHHRYCCKATI